MVQARRKKPALAALWQKNLSTGAICKAWEEVLEAIFSYAAGFLHCAVEQPALYGVRELLVYYAFGLCPGRAAIFARLLNFGGAAS